MVMVNSTMLPLGTKAPNFNLPLPSGKKITLSNFAGTKGLVVLFLSNHCPFVQHIKKGLIDFAKDYQSKGVGIIGICSNDIEKYPDDSPENMKKENYPFPYAFDETQEIAKAYRAACTPDIFLFDGNLKLIYRGQFDASRPGNNKPVTGKDLRMAVDALLQGEFIEEGKQVASVGCNIKWKADNAPDYFSA